MHLVDYICILHSIVFAVILAVEFCLRKWREEWEESVEVRTCEAQGVDIARREVGGDVEEELG